MSRVTLNGWLAYNPELFNSIVLPEALDKTLLIDLILETSGDLYTYYQQPHFLKRNIENWFMRMFKQFERMSAALTAEYNPIHNYDRTEEYTDSRTGTRTDRTDTIENVTNESNLTSNGENDSITTNDVSAFNESTYQPENKTTTQATSTQTTASDSTDRRDSTVDLTSGTTDTATHSAKVYGNIGVMTTQAMIREELDVRTIDIYNKIVSMFEKQFLIQVY